MSLSQQTLLDLMAFADGEVDGDERARLEKLVAESPEAASVVEAMRAPALGAFLGGEIDRVGTAADGIADAVMTKLEAPVPLRRRPAAVTATVIGSLALAAGLALWVTTSRTHGDDPQAPVASVGAPAPDIAPAPASRPVQGVEVDELDSPSRAFSVFEIPVSGGAAGAAAQAGAPSSVVIMIDDDPSGSGAGGK